MELHYLTMLGLLLIAAGWLMQYARMKKGRQEIMKEFVSMNCIGIALLIVDGFLAGLYDVALFNVFTLSGSLLVLFRISK